VLLSNGGGVQFGMLDVHVGIGTGEAADARLTANPRHTNATPTTTPTVRRRAVHPPPAARHGLPFAVASTE
jgi:hypothetical protein